MSAMCLLKPEFPKPQRSVAPTTDLAEKRSRLQALRAQVGALDGSLPTETYTWAECPVGIPKGSLVEVQGSGRHEFLAQFLATQNATRKAWVEKSIEIFPAALAQRGVLLSSLIFVEAEDHSAWVLQQLLQSQIFSFVVATDVSLEDRQQRKLQLLAEKAGSTVFLSQDQVQPSWVPTLSLHVNRLEEGINIDVLRKRGAL